MKHFDILNPFYAGCRPGTCGHDANSGASFSNDSIGNPKYVPAVRECFLKESRLSSHAKYLYNNNAFWSTMFHFMMKYSVR